MILVAKMVINDFLRGKIPWYIPDPHWPERKAKDKDDDEFAESEGRLGEMRLKIGQVDAEAGDSESWDGLDDESDCDGDGDDDDDGDDDGIGNREIHAEEDVEDRIGDPRPAKKIKL